MNNITRCIGLIFEYALNGVVSLEALYRKFVVELTFRPPIPCLCFITQLFMVELCAWMEREYEHGIEGEKETMLSYDDCWIMYVETIGCWFHLSMVAVAVSRRRKHIRKIHNKTLSPTTSYP